MDWTDLSSLNSRRLDGIFSSSYRSKFMLDILANNLTNTIVLLVLVLATIPLFISNRTMHESFKLQLKELQ